MSTINETSAGEYLVLAHTLPSLRVISMTIPKEMTIDEYESWLSLVESFKQSIIRKPDVTAGQEPAQPRRHYAK